MELEERVAALELRLAAVESADGAAAPRPGGDFWALEGLKQLLGEDEANAAEVADGAVLFTGAVRLPTREQYEWQYGEPTSALLESDWPAAAESFAALGHAVRLRLLREILGGLRTAAALAELDELGTTGQIYHHLRQLTAAGWLKTSGRGQYEVPVERVVPLLVMMSAARP
ncbi:MULTISPECIES: winged helix-turn-helix domain-containing protein [unclassified Streptomyces]|uniref:ArsR/SmtB family transcription factor n=1 Tax=unclassified Streptomyces TaxID=2593676 RepID=UPI00324C1354